MSTLQQKDFRKERRDDGKVAAAGSSSEKEQMGPQRWKQPKGEDWTEMKKEAKLLRCTLLNGSVWRTERKYMRRYKESVVFSWVLSMVNKEANEGWRFAADAARITDETAGIEDQKLDS